MPMEPAEISPCLDASPGVEHMPPPTRVIRPSRGWAPLDLRDLWAHRELVFFMARRDVRLRYRQTLLGVGWAVLQPVATCLVFTLFLGRLGQLPSDGFPYAVFTLAGLVLWQMFANALLLASNSLVDNRAILSKVRFPRVILPLAAIAACLLDFAVAALVLVVVMATSAIAPGARALAVPAFVALATVAAAGAGLWLATLNVRYRDVRHTVPFLTQFWLFATPVAYPASLVPERWRPWLGLNPMAGAVEGFRWAILGRGDVSPGLLGTSAAAAVALLVTGLLYFRRMERSFADVI